MINNNNLDQFNVFLFTFHDQALIPFKIISNLKGINFTSNLKVIRLSPSHGTARNLKDLSLSSSTGIVNCLKTIRKIYKNRINF
jgi:4-hydroxythreonine-4-phosphate dehydrogenase